MERAITEAARFLYDRISYCSKRVEELEEKRIRGKDIWIMRGKLEAYEEIAERLQYEILEGE